MSDQNHSEAHRQGAEAGADIDKQAGDCPYDHEGVELDLRGAWMAGFAEGRQRAKPAEAARDYEEVAPRAPVDPDLPVYFTG